MGFQNVLTMFYFCIFDIRAIAVLVGNSGIKPVPVFCPVVLTSFSKILFHCQCKMGKLSTGIIYNADFPAICQLSGCKIWVCDAL